MKYDIWCGKCVSGIKCDIYNRATDESINIDAFYDDVKKLYEVLKEFFENGEKDVKEGVFK